MKILVGLCLLLIIYDVGAPPVNEKKKKKDKEHEETNEIDQQVSFKIDTVTILFTFENGILMNWFFFEVFDVEYKRYLQEVVNVLESDDDFRQRLMKADPEDIKVFCVKEKNFLKSIL